MRYSLLFLRSLSSLEREIQTIQRYIEDLEKFKQMKNLEAELKLNLCESFGSRYRCKSHSNLLSNYKEIKLPNILLFDLEFSIKQQDKWLIDLKQTFQGAKKKYKKDEQKILKTFASIVSKYKAHWQRYFLELNEFHLQ